MRVRRCLTVLFGGILLLIGGPVSAQNLTITQVDTSRLLTGQRIGVYLSVTDSQGEPIRGLSASQFRVAESPAGDRFSRRDVGGLTHQSNAEAGITFFLLVDNSGSMYDTLSGEETDDPERMRISHARNAIRTFSNEMDNPRDRVGLATFNTYYTLHNRPTQRKVRVTEQLQGIERPERASSYTELYASLAEAGRDLGGYLGRKVLIVLSDGENYPYTRYEEEPHPDYGTHVFEYQEPIEVMQREGISVFAIHFARERDEHLSDIARETGGRVYDARNESELASVYSDIRRRVLEEYYLTYRASMSPADRTYVRVRFDRDAAPVAGESTSAETDAFQADATATRYYYSTTILGKPGDGFNWLYLLALPGAVLLWFGLAQLRFRNRRRDANLELLGGGARTRVTGLSGAQTVIGASEDADVTIAGQPSVQSQHATVVRDEKKGSYTVVGEAPIRVNNRPVSKKELEPGDVISVGDATVVFDGPPESSSEDAPEKDESEGSEEAERGSDKGKGKRGSGKGKKEE